MKCLSILLFIFGGLIVIKLFTDIILTIKNEYIYGKIHNILYNIINDVENDSILIDSDCVVMDLDSIKHDIESYRRYARTLFKLIQSAYSKKTISTKQYHELISGYSYLRDAINTYSVQYRNVLKEKERKNG